MKNLILGGIVGSIVSGFLVSAYLNQLYSNELKSLISESAKSQIIDNIRFITLMDENGILSEERKKEEGLQLVLALSILSTIKPDVSAFTAAPKEALCKAIEYEESGGISFELAGEAGDHVASYLSEIKKPLMDSIKKSQSVLGGSGCKLSFGLRQLRPELFQDEKS
ncbi:MAG: hypothetical protein KDI17_05525 [Halioglobus sp.]|nr:hypothetical protein [Halioglobus sp.]